MNSWKRKIATLNNQLLDEKNAALKPSCFRARMLIPMMHKLDQTIARYLSQGVEAEQIRLALQSLARPVRCRVVEQREIAVATGFFAGKEATAEMLGSSMQVFVEGEVGRDFSRDRPWFDPEKPVSIRIAYLGGEKLLPVHCRLKQR